MLAIKLPRKTCDLCPGAYLGADPSDPLLHRNQEPPIWRLPTRIQSDIIKHNQNRQNVVGRLLN